jgi:hypothetical protein
MSRKLWVKVETSEGTAGLSRVAADECTYVNEFLVQFSISLASFDAAQVSLYVADGTKIKTLSLWPHSQTLQNTGVIL